MVDTYGGSFRFSVYEPSDDGDGAAREVGATLKLFFTPNALVEAAHIGLVQTVTTYKSSGAGEPATVPSFVSRHKANQAISAADGDAGRVIDQSDRASDGSTPNTSPIYCVENGRVGGGPRLISVALADVPPDPAKGYGGFGSRVRHADGSFVVEDATLRDHPVRALEFEGQAWTQRFEVGALALDGPMANVWLGAVEWGWRFDGALVRVDPSALRLVAAGAPSAPFMAAVSAWNSGVSVFDWWRVRRYPNVTLPVVTLDGGTLAAAHLDDAALAARLAVVETQLRPLPPGVDRANKNFERRALQTEIAARAAGVVPAASS